MEEKKITPQAEEKHIEVTELKQKQTFLNLDSGDEDEIVVVTKKYSVPEGMPTEKAIAEMRKVVHPDSEVLTALTTYAASKSYSESKAAALAKGNYLTQEVKSAVVAVLQMNPTFAEMKAKDVFAKWYEGYKAKKPGAIKALDRARAANEFSDLL